MYTSLRYGLFAVGAAMLALAVGFFWQMAWAVNLWPWPESRLSYIFLASITAAIAAASIWVAVSEEYGALRSQALNTAAATAGVAATALFLHPVADGIGTLALGSVAVVFCALGLATFLAIRKYPIKDPRPMPGPVRVSFAFFTILLIVVGGSMVLGSQLFPWPLKPGSLTAYGFVFLGACVYFFYPVLRPSWHNARGQLWAFLAYDVVLIVPFLGHFERVAPDRVLNLSFYMLAIVYSGALAIYYLFINPLTRPAAPPSSMGHVQTSAYRSPGREAE